MASPVSQQNRNNTLPASAVGFFCAAGWLGGRSIVQEATEKVASWREANFRLRTLSITNEGEVFRFIAHPMAYNQGKNTWEKKNSNDERDFASGVRWTKIVREGRTYKVDPGSIQGVLSAVINKTEFMCIKGVKEVSGTREAEINVSELPRGSYVYHNDKVYAVTFEPTSCRLLKGVQEGCFDVVEDGRIIPGIQAHNLSWGDFHDLYVMELKIGEPSDLTWTIHAHPHAVKALTTLASVISGFAATSFLFRRRT